MVGEDVDGLDAQVGLVDAVGAVDDKLLRRQFLDEVLYLIVSPTRRYLIVAVDIWDDLRQCLLST